MASVDFVRCIDRMAADSVNVEYHINDSVCSQLPFA